MIKRPVGYVVTQHFCLDCAPEGLRDFYEPMREGEDHGVPYSCDMCGKDMTPDAS